MVRPLLVALVLASLACVDTGPDPRVPARVASDRGEATPRPEAAAAMELGRAAHDAARYDEALAHYERALRATPATDGLGMARLYNLIGKTRYEKVEPIEALAVHDKALALQLAQLGPRDPEVGRTRVLRAQALWLKGDNDAALGEFESALAIQLATAGGESPEVGGSYSNIGNVYWAKGDYEQALVYYEKALVVQRRVKGADHLDVATTLHNMAISSREKGDHDRCLALEAEALAILVARRGAVHPDLAESYITMALARTAKGEHDAAMALLGKALALQMRGYGPAHAELAWTYSSVVDVHLAKREFGRALALYRRTLALEIGTFGPTHPEVAQDHLRIGDFLAARAGAVYEGGLAAALLLYEHDADPRRREQAFSFAEKGKAALLLEALAGAQARRFASIPGELLEQERRLRVELAFYDRQLGEKQLEAGADVAPLQEKLFALGRERDLVQRRLEAESRSPGRRSPPPSSRPPVSRRTWKRCDVRSWSGTWPAMRRPRTASTACSSSRSPPRSPAGI